MTRANNRINLVFLTILLLTVICFASIGIIFNTAYADADPGRFEKSVKIAHLSDTHIYIEDFCNPLSKKYNLKLNSDVKLLEESTAAIQASLDLIFEEKADYLIVSGDLTSNAEVAGHIKIAEMFADLTTRMRAVDGYENFQIFVTPGNHDLYNSGAANYMPSQAQLDACADDDERLELLENYEEFVDTASLQQFFDIYADFGYGGVNCIGNLEYFYDSEYWYDNDDPLKPKKPSQAVIDAFDDSTDDYAILAPYARAGALSYIVRNDDFTLISFDATTRTYEGDKGADDGWEHKTGGFITDEMLKWAIDSTRPDVSDNKLIISMTHQNYLPHFAMEDKILKDFTLFRWEQVSYTLADNGIKYGFTGHMHSNDIQNYVTQNGNVFYDFETGAPISYGAPVRFVRFDTELEGSVYTENLYSTIVPTDVGITYQVPVYNFETGLIEYENRSISNLIDHLDELLTEMIPRLVDGYLNEDFIFDTLRDMLVSLKGAPLLDDTLYNLAIKFVNELQNLNVYAPIFSDEYNPGSTYTFSATPQEGYNLFDLVDELIHWLINQDVTFGKAANPYTLTQAVSEIYKNHISGADSSTMSAELTYLVEEANSGRLVVFLVDTLKDFLFPQLDLLTSAPIRKDTTAPALAPGEGFDIAVEFEALYAKALGKVFAPLFGDDLFTTLGNIADMANTLLDNALVKSFLKSFGIMDTIDSYAGTILGYLDNMLGYGTITQFINYEIIDKYFTDALSTNLGIYVGQIISGWAIDYTEDGAYLDHTVTDRFWNVVYIEDFHVIYSETEFGGNTYQIDTAVANSGKVEVVPTIKNGLLPSMLSVSFGNEVTTTMEFKWYTKIQIDVYDLDDIPASYFKYWTEGNQSNALTVTANSANVEREIPLIDLGITYITKAIHRFNMHTISLEDLAPGTRYYYTVGSDDYGWSDTYSFRTGGTEGPITILAIADIQGSVEKNYLDSLDNFRIALDKVVDPAFILSAGDNVDKGSSTYHWQWLLDGQREVWANNTFVTVSGNHEVDDYCIDDFLALPSNVHHTPTGHYYSYDYGNTHFVILNTNDLGADNALSAAQTAWLIDDLEANKQNPLTKWTIVTLHKGLYTAGSHAFDSDVIALRAQLTPIFIEGGVDLVLQGHDHTYSLTEYIGADGKPVKVTYDKRGAAINPTGIPYINLGTIGDKFYNYIYHEDVYLKQRSAKHYKNTPLAQYFVNGNLELTETPVFAKLDIDDNNLSVITYTIIDGVAVKVDTVIISDAPEYGLSGGAIAGIAIGSVVGAGGIGFAIFWFLVRRKKMVA